MKLDILSISTKTEEKKDSILKLYEKKDLLEEKKELERTMSEIESTNDIVITLIGQYSAGKSTIISALTGNRNIEIDANIATSKATSYKWSDQIQLVDSPGLYTENLDHDEETEEAIKKSDILVYCITNELFDEITIRDYKKWMYDLNYKDKMFLIINKMSREIGEYDELKANYIESINKSLSPYDIEDVEYNFIDAKDYIDGQEEDIIELIEYSRFEEFKSNLNQFAEDRGLTSKLDTPIKALISSIDCVLSESLKDDDKNLIKLLNRAYKDVDRSISQINKRANVFLKSELADFYSYGIDISQSIGTEGFNFNELEFESKLEKVGLNINEGINNVLEEEYNVLEEEILQLLDSNMANIYFRGIANEQEYDGIALESDEKSRTNFNFLKKMDNLVVKNKILELSGTAGKTASQISGSGLHTTVRTVGQKIGYKFKPWQAVNIAKNIGKAFAAINIGFEVFSLIKDLENAEQQEKEEEKIMVQRVEFRKEVLKIIENMEVEYRDVIKNMTASFKEILKNIEEIRESKLSELEDADDFKMELQRQKKELRKLEETISGGIE